MGATPMMFPEGFAARLPKGSDFLLQMHFHLSGKPETEKSLIGIYFADKAPDKDLFSVELPALFGFGAGIDIPPGEKRYTIRDSFTLPGDVSVYSAMAHAHYLAKEMKATATLPDGSTKPLIWINDWDFNWQDSYVYKKPFTLPKGTRIDVTLTYDNSADNPRNPINPPRRALWGEQSFDEMGTVGFGFEVLNKADVPAFQEALATRIEGGDCRRREGRHARAFPGVASSGRTAACNSSRCSIGKATSWPGWASQDRIRRRRSRPTAHDWR